MQTNKKAVFNKLLYSGLIVIAILVMQPLEVWYFFNDNAVLFPYGLIGLMQRDLLLFIQIVMLLFVVPVYVLTFAFSWWYRADNKKAKYDPHLVDNKIAEVIWWGVPFLMTAIVCVVSVIKTYELDPYKPIESENKPVVVQAVALDWKWLFIYPEEKIATVNYLQIPVDTPIQFLITADAPMNAFWIPRLGGMIYAMPGMQTTLNLIANREGTFRGSSANISGKGFAGMVFKTEATTDEAYQKWLATVKKSDKTLSWSEYETLAKPSENNPVGLYRLGEEKLFHKILMKYMEPMSKM